MKVLVYDIPAVHGGALTILRECYQYAISRTDIEWLFVVSVPEFVSTDNVSVVCVDKEVRKRFNRIIYERRELGKICAENKCDCIISLVNTVLPVKKIKQIVYMHNSIPFSDIKFSFLHDRSLWIYKHIIGRLIRSSMKKCDGIIIQTEWIKEAIKEQCDVPEDKFIKCPPCINEGEYSSYQDTEEARKTFIYPAGKSSYKNHKIILEAVRILTQQGITDFKVNFTLSDQDMQSIFADPQLSPVKNVKFLSHSELMKKYAESVLLFPSKLETFGLPMMEARKCNAFIIAGDMPFSKEVLNGYENAFFFNVDDATQLAKIMEGIISGNTAYSGQADQSDQISSSGWDNVVAYLNKCC